MKFSILPCALMLAMSGSVFAEQELASGAEEPHQFMISLGAGYAFSSGISQSDVESALTNAGYDGKVSDFSDSDIGYQIWLGWLAREGVAVELGYLDFGERTGSIIDQGYESRKLLAESLPQSISGFALAVRPEYDFNSDWSVYGRLGVMFWDSDSQVTGYNVKDSGSEILLGAGAKYRLNDDWFVSAGWSSVKVEKTSNHLMSVNAGYRFGI